MDIKILSPAEINKVFEKNSTQLKNKYLAFYSSWLGGIVRDAGFFVAPMDDHLVHRGDGVFEALRVINGRAFDLGPHLDRMERSASLIGLKFPFSRREVEECVTAVIAVAGSAAGMVRMYLSRGPGGFSASPAESIGPQLYIVVTTFTPVAEEKYSSGVSLMISSIPQKENFFSQIKSCNYLQNVLVKKESLERGFDFAISLTADGHLAEGPTENILLLNEEGALMAPSFDYTLKGTTLVRVMKLAEKLCSQGLVKEIGVCHMHKDDLLSAREVMMVGTTLEVLPVGRIENVVKPVGPVALELRKLLRAEML